MATETKKETMNRLFAENGLLAEDWLPIEGYEGLYEISSYGRMLSIKSNRSRILKPLVKTDGYCRFCLCKGNVKQYFYIHRLVAQHFLLPPMNGRTYVNHIDGNKKNNQVNNLEWCFDSENKVHAFKYGLMDQKGSKNASSILDEGKVLEIRSLVAKGVKQKDAASIYGVHIVTVSQIITRKTWKHI